MYTTTVCGACFGAGVGVTTGGAAGVEEGAVLTVGAGVGNLLTAGTGVGIGATTGAVDFPIKFNVVMEVSCTRQY